jgi:hypothetical protein
VKQTQSQYLQLTVFFILLSVAAYTGLNWLKSQPSPRQGSETVEASPTPNIQEPTLIPDSTTTGMTPPLQSNTPTSTSLNKPSPTIDDLGPTSTFKFFTSPIDNFSVTYSSSRKLYQDTESDKINRYTFYRNDSNFAIHVGREAWSWEHPNRDFSGNFLVSGQNTFRFQTAGQTIVDIDKNGLKYTLQCIHGDQSAIVSECDSFLKSFKLN